MKGVHAAEDEVRDFVALGDGSVCLRVPAHNRCDG